MNDVLRVHECHATEQLTHDSAKFQRVKLARNIVAKEIAPAAVLHHHEELALVVANAVKLQNTWMDKQSKSRYLER